MAWTQTDIDALEAAMAKGVLEVEYQNQRVRYRSLAEMRQILADMRASIATSSPRYADTIYDRT